MGIENQGHEELSPQANEADQATDGQNAELPPADPEEDQRPQSLSDVIENALGGNKSLEDDEQGENSDPDDEPGEEAEDGSASEEGEEETSEEEGSPEEGKKPSFQDHPNWQKMVAKKNELQDQVETLSPKAEQFDKITGFLQESGVTGEEASDALHIMAAIKKGNAREAYSALEPIFRQLEKQVGVTMPQDLQEQVQQGYITPEYAQQLSQANAQIEELKQQVHQLSNRSEQQQQSQREEQAQRQHQELLSQSDAAASKWSSDKKTSDPDFERKEPFLEAELSAWARKNGAPKTANDVVRALDESYQAITERLRGVVPPKPGIKPQQRRPSTQKSAKPGSFEDAFNAGLKGA